MRKLPRIALCAVVLGTLVPLAAFARPDEDEPKPGTKKRASAKETFAVIELRGEIRVVKTSEIAGVEKELAKEHKEALSEYRQAKKEAQKSKKRFVRKPPTRPKIRVVSRRLPTEEAAEAARKKAVLARDSKAGGFAVVQVGSELRAIKKPELTGLKKEVERDYKTALAEWEESRKEARKAKQKFTEPRPTKVAVKLVKSGFPTAEAAESEIVKIQEKENAKSKPRSRKSDKKKDAASPPG